jgi:DNA-directed RNA polymerase specialized sigma24 family protein
MEGYTNEEIAAKLDCAVPTVERRLRWIRKLWSQQP